MDLRWVDGFCEAFDQSMFVFFVNLGMLSLSLQDLFLTNLHFSHVDF